MRPIHSGLSGSVRPPKLVTDMNIRFPTSLSAVSIFVTLAGGGAWSGSVQPAPAPPQVAPAEDPARLQLEAQLKELQRREQFDTMDLKSREALLMNIINYCIELGRDFNTYQEKLKAVQDQLKKQGVAVAQQQQREQRNSQLKSRALQAMTADPPRWSEASRTLDQAIRLFPKDAETLALKAQADRGLRQLIIYRVALGSLVGIAGVGVLAVAYKTLRKGRGVRVRQLEMVEGPQLGETFRLEKDTTTLGALAAEADWVIADPSRRISRRHCDISRSGRHYFLTDCSSNGTFVNGKPAPKGEPILLRKGDRIALAEDVILKFR